MSIDGVPELVVVIVASLITALATGLGAIPFLFLKKISKRMVSRSDALAAGLMVGASFALFIEGSDYGAAQTLIGANLGLLAVLLTKRILRRHDVEVHDLVESDSQTTLLFLAVMTAHSFAEGIAVGAAFGGAESLAGAVTIAIAVHNIPEGLAISAVMRPRGVSVLKCSGWAIFSSLPQVVMAVPAFLFVEYFTVALPYALGFAGGAMLVMVFVELLPEAYADDRPQNVAFLA
ncbi:MAG: ZIP family metal transporter, partial [Myxococcales bacterium]|nr:ZIP family metal transporter [Myxococcales bacterium]